MSSHSVIWTAAACKRPGAGIYIGAAPQREHLIVARALSRRQLKVFVGGRVRVPDEHRPWQLYYYAVRDPSAVRVVPNGGYTAGATRMAAAELRFRFPPMFDEAVASGPRAVAADRDAPPAAFLLTIGLGAGADRAFFDRTIGEQDHGWAEVFDLIAERGCQDEAA